MTARRDHKRRSGPGLPVALFVAFGLATSVVLVPRSYERALQEMNAGDLDDAQTRLAAMWTSGDRQPAIAAALANALVDGGDLDGAIALLQETARIHPGDMGVLEELANLYQGTGRLREQAQILHRQQGASPTRARQETLADVYRLLGDSENQRAATWSLVRDYGVGHARLFELARLEAAAGNAEGALDALDLQQAFPRFVRPEAVSLAIALELGRGDVDRAIDRGRRWIETHGSSAAAIETIANIILTQRRPDVLAQLLAPLAVRGAPLVAYEDLGYARFRAGDIAGARRVLDDLARDGGTRWPALTARLRLALAINAPDHVLTAARRLPPRAIPPPLLRGVAAVALGQRDTDLLRRLAHRMRRTVFDQEPVLAARVMIALRRFGEAENWLAAARRVGSADPEFRLAIAHADMGLRRRGRALQEVRAVFGDPPAPGFPVAEDALSRQRYADLSGDALMLAASLYLDLGAPREGQAMLDAYRRVNLSVEADQAWALVAVAAGRQSAVIAWQREAASEDALSPPFLRELASRALAVGAHDLAAITARRLVGMRGSDDDRLLMATALVAAARPLASNAEETTASR